MNKILLPVILNRFSSRVDGSYGLSISTDILSDEQLLAVKKLHNTTCVMLLKDAEIEPSEKELIETFSPEDAIMLKKSPSQRLRNVLWIIAQQNGCDPDEFYRTEMTKIEQHYKNKIL